MENELQRLEAKAYKLLCAAKSIRDNILETEKQIADLRQAIDKARIPEENKDINNQPTPSGE
jgi:SMC interacting uncharacterized protein involved in chromosome segregation